MTAHRCQGSTSDSTYALEDGGGRELAYVAMSRARRESHVHVVAPDLGSAARHLAWAWAQERRHAWALAERREQALAQLLAERQRLLAALPPDPSHQLRQVRQDHSQVERDLLDLYEGAGRWVGTGSGRGGPSAAPGVCRLRRGVSRARQSWPVGQAQGPQPTGRRRYPPRWRPGGVGQGRRAPRPPARRPSGPPRRRGGGARATPWPPERPIWPSAQRCPAVWLSLNGAIARGQELVRLHHLVNLRQREQARHVGVSHHLHQDHGADL